MADDESASEKGAAIVTGATRGIGYELARLFAATGHDVVLVARTEGDLAETAAGFTDRFGVRAETVAADLTDPDAPERVQAATADLSVTALVNNAGYAAAGRLDAADAEETLGILDLKARAATELTRRYLPTLVDGPREGRLLNVASASAFVPGPRNAVYHAVNDYLLSLSRSLTAELADAAVTVTCLCPGRVDTDFHERAGTDERKRGLVPTLALDPRPVARAGFRGLRRGETVVVPGVSMRLLTAVARVTPGPIARRVMRYYNRGL